MDLRSCEYCYHFLGGGTCLRKLDESGYYYRPTVEEIESTNCLEYEWRAKVLQQQVQDEHFNNSIVL